MEFHFKELTVEEDSGGHIVSRTVLFPVYTVMTWFDDLAGYHQLMLCGSDLVWLSKMGVSMGDGDG
jgi:hypothetical protein